MSVAGKDSSSARDSGRASIGLLDRIKESSSEESDEMSTVSASSKLQRRSFDLASALGLMSSATSKGEGQEETEISGYLDTAGTTSTGACACTVQSSDTACPFPYIWHPSLSSPLAT